MGRGNHFDGIGGIFSTSIFGHTDRLLPEWDGDDELDALVDDDDNGRHRREEAVWPESMKLVEASPSSTLHEEKPFEFKFPRVESVPLPPGDWYLWLDDERDPRVVLAPDNGPNCLGLRYAQYATTGLAAVDWKWAKSVTEAIALCEEHGAPKVMALDHDLGLGPDLSTPQTVMPFLRWLSERADVTTWFVHSANPVGRDNIASYMRSWESVAEIVAASEKRIAVDFDEDAPLSRPSRA